jgi:lipopolysaccharide/colanic/teichoic acid biosynthesis glycosyltransferase
MNPWPLHRRIVKRGFDLLVSTIALAILGLPLLALAILVRASSPGPALFRQPRVGRGGKPFHIWKLRTMVDGAASLGPAVTVDGDPRITRLGRFLRKSKLDELPQLVNVWLGDMSVIGPRPEVPKYVSQYADEDRLVLAVRPGITDAASIQFRDEEEVLARFSDRERAYLDEVLPRKLALARAYVRSQTFLGDLQLLFRTFVVVLRPR